MLSPSEVYTLYAGQALSTSRSICSAGTAVPVEVRITFHMAVAALWGHSSVSGGSGPQHCGLGCCRGLCWPSALSPASAHRALLAAARQPPCRVQVP